MERGPAPLRGAPTRRLSPSQSGTAFYPLLCWQLALSVALGSFLMALMLPGLVLARDTTGHDWYPAGRKRIPGPCV